MRIGYKRDELDRYKKFSAVILAAGLSSRMKDFKPLLPVDGRPAIEGLIEAAKGAGVEDIVIVTGHERERLQPVIRKYDLVEAFNPDYERGMFTSIQTGVNQIPVFCSPFIQSSVIEKLFAVFNYEWNDIVMQTFFQNY